MFLVRDEFQVPVIFEFEISDKCEFGRLHDKRVVLVKKVSVLLCLSENIEYNSYLWACKSIEHVLLWNQRGTRVLGEWRRGQSNPITYVKPRLSLIAFFVFLLLQKNLSLYVLALWGNQRPPTSVSSTFDFGSFSSAECVDQICSSPQLITRS